MSMWVNIDWLKEQTGYRDTETLKRRILLPYREELEKFIYYPRKRGERWKINKPLMLEWLQNNIS